jgi:radical SAM superfamily enzyme YgiQ (UPF0313 family)
MLAIPGETRDDAFDTMRMVQRMNYKYLSPSFFAPYPGSVLGYQMMKEGSSLLTADNYHRYPHDEKVRGMDYAFYRELLSGQYDDEIALRPEPSAASTNDPFVRHKFYLFETLDGRRKLTYGEDPKQALDILRSRGGAQEENRICAKRWINVSPSDLPYLVSKLGQDQDQ